MAVGLVAESVNKQSQKTCFGEEFLEGSDEVSFEPCAWIITLTHPAENITIYILRHPPVSKMTSDFSILNDQTWQTVTG